MNGEGSIENNLDLYIKNMLMEIDIDKTGDNKELYNEVEETQVEYGKTSTEEITKISTASETDYSIFNFELSEDKRGYIISAKCIALLPKVITIPSHYMELPVIKIKDYGFSDASILEIVTFEEDSVIECIGNYSFYGCVFIKSIELPATVKEIGDFVFHLYEFKSVYLSSITPPKLGHRTFGYDESITIFVPKESLETYKNAAKAGNWHCYLNKIYEGQKIVPTNLGYFRFHLNDDHKSYSVKRNSDFKLPEKVVIPSTYNKLQVTRIEYYGFSDTIIKSLVLPETMENIDDYAFCNSIGFKELIIPSRVKRIGKFAFSFHMWVLEQGYVFSDSALEKIIFLSDEGLRHIDEGAFFGNMKLKEFNIPKSTVVIGSAAFTACGLRSLFIPEGIELIGLEPCSFCTELKGFTVDEKNKNYCEIDGILYNKAVSDMISYPLALEKSIYRVPNSIRVFGGFQTLTFCKHLRVIRYNTEFPPEILTTLKTAVKGFKIYVPSENYDNYINQPVWNLMSDIIYKDDIIQNGFAVIDSRLVQYVEDEKEIRIPDKVEEIEPFALGPCLNLKKIIVADENKNFKSIDGVLFNSDLTELIAYPTARGGSSYEVPVSVKSIGTGAFYNCKKVIKLLVHRELELIKDYAFYCCDNLGRIANLDDEDNIKELGYYSFFLCAAFNEIDLVSIQKVKRNALFLCSNLSILTLGNQIESFESEILLEKFTSSKLQYLNIYSVIPPQFNGFGTSQETVLIFVPPESVENYKNAPGWNKYKDNIFPMFLKIMN